MTAAEHDRLRELEAARFEATFEGKTDLALELDRLRSELLASVNGDGTGEDER